MSKVIRIIFSKKKLLNTASNKIIYDSNEIFHSLFRLYWHSTITQNTNIHTTQEHSLVLRPLIPEEFRTKWERRKRAQKQTPSIPGRWGLRGAPWRAVPAAGWAAAPCLLARKAWRPTLQLLNTQPLQRRGDSSPSEGDCGETAARNRWAIK